MADSAAAGCLKINLLSLAPKVIDLAKRRNLESCSVYVMKAMGTEKKILMF